MKKPIVSILLVIVINGYPSGIFAKEEAKRFVLVSGEEQGLYYRLSGSRQIKSVGTWAFLVSRTGIMDEKIKCIDKLPG